MNFFKEKLPFISFGKLRTSYGITGMTRLVTMRFKLWTSGDVTYQGAAALLPANCITRFGMGTNKKLEGAIELGFFKDNFY